MDYINTALLQMNAAYLGVTMTTTRTRSYGRIVFGASAVLFGVLGILWHDVATWESASNIWALPGGVAIGECLMLAQIAGGIGIQVPFTARASAIVLTVIYSIFTLACIPGIVATPASYGPYGEVFYQLSAVCGAIALLAAAATNGRRVTTIGGVARLALGLCATSFTLSQIFYFRFTASLVPTWVPPGQTFWAVLTTVAFALAAIALLTNRWARIAACSMAVMLVLFGLLVWVPRLVVHPHDHGNWHECADNFLIAGAAWLVGSLESF